MKRKLFTLLFVLFILCSLLVAEANSKNAESGTSVLSFLKLGAHAKGLSMGEALTAQSDEVSTPFWNPAGLWSIKGTRISLTHTQWFQDITAEHFSSATQIGENAFGLSLSLGKVPDIQKRDEVPTTEPLALFDAHDVAFLFSYARNLRKNCGVGASMKWLYEKIEASSASGWGFDLGVICLPFFGSEKAVLGNLALGAAVLNLGSKMKFEKESYSLPTQYKAGISYSAQKERWHSDFTLNLDLLKPRDDNMKVHFGGEYGLYETLNLRLGYQFGYDEKNLSFGMGIKFRKYAIDYAFVPYKSDLGDVHCISLDVEF